MLNDIEAGNKTIYIDNEEYTYKGQIKHIDGKTIAEGKGILYSQDGKIVYEGDFVNDKFEGQGKYVYEDGEYYIGQWKNGDKHGTGKLYYKNGNTKYDGEFVNDKFEGQGKYVYEDGEYYIGQWKNGDKHGTGKLYYKNGKIGYIRYSGEFVDNKFHGTGTYFYNNGEYYTGQWKNGDKHGTGTLYYKNGNIRYEGEFVDNKFHGTGKYVYEDGEYYIGQWKNGNRHGTGKLYYKNGKIGYIRYSGEFVDNKFHGTGTYFYNNGEYYMGQWENGNQHGRGELHYKNGSIKYDGEFVDNKFHGTGKYIYEDGEYYIGQWKNGKKEGRGTYFYKNGEYYIGQWKNGNQHGKGRLYYEKIDLKYQGEFVDNKFHGTGTLYYKNGNIRYQGEFVDNQFHGKGKYFYIDGECYIGQWKNGILVDEKKYSKKTVEKRKDVFLQQNEYDEEEKFKDKHEKGFYIKPNGTNKDVLDNNTDHLKMYYDDHGDDCRRLKKTIDNKLFKPYDVNNNLKSIYISSATCHGGFYDTQGNDLFQRVEDMMKDNENCIGFVSLMKKGNACSVEKTTNNHNKKGLKRVPSRKKNKEAFSIDYDKNNDVEYYCTIKEAGENHTYLIPAQLCYWREKLIDDGKFIEAFNTLKDGKDYTFKADVVLNDEQGTEQEQLITIPCSWGKDKNQKIKKIEVKKSLLHNSQSSVNINDIAFGLYH